MKRNYFLMSMAVLLTVSVLGCNAMRGVGKDVQNAGGSIQKTVDHND